MCFCFPSNFAKNLVLLRTKDLTQEIYLLLIKTKEYTLCSCDQYTHIHEWFDERTRHLSNFDNVDLHTPIISFFIKTMCYSLYRKSIKKSIRLHYKTHLPPPFNHKILQLRPFIFLFCNPDVNIVPHTLSNKHSNHHTHIFSNRDFLREYKFHPSCNCKFYPFLNLHVK